ncbi:hypothetical protein DFH28DRAFT_1077810 [Melampsora americana]|nr:hypothetical protein DFH28DRAFT_1077810 [Melampsora americana]
MHLILSFAVAQLPLLAQAFLLHPYYKSNPKARLIRLALVPIGVSLLFSFGLRWRTNFPGWISTSANKTFGQLLIILALRCMIWGITSAQYYRLSPFDSSKSPETCLRSPLGLDGHLAFLSNLKTKTMMPSSVLTIRRLLINTTVFLTSLELLVLFKKSVYFGIFPFCYLKAFLAMPLFWDAYLDSWPVIFNLNKDEYPFFIDSVHKSSSLTEFWSRRWHSCLRHTLIKAAARPTYNLVTFIGKNYSKGITEEIAQAAGLLSAFLMSGLVHEFGLWFATHLDWSFRTTTFFLSQGVGILIEKVFTRLTGRRVGGVPAWTFGLIWILFWIQPMVNACIEHGIMNLDQMPTLSLWLFDECNHLTSFQSLEYTTYKR